MTRSPRVTKGRWALFVASLTLLSGVIATRLLRPISDHASDLAEAALRAELATLPEFDARELARWREQQTTLAAERWTAAKRDALQEKLGSRWTWERLDMDRAARSYRLRAVAPETLPWAAVRNVIASLESAPGLSVEAVTITSAGTRTVRTIAAVEIQLRFQWTEAGTVNTVPPESVRRDRVLRRPVLSERAAGSRARAAALRLPSASAKPPAPVRRSRPDHPRLVRVVLTHLSEPQPT